MDYYYIALIIFIFLSILIVLFYDYYYNRENFIILKNEHIYYEREVRRKVKNNNLNNIRTYPSDIKEYSYSEPIYIENNLNSNDNNNNENDDDNIIEKNDEKIYTNNNNLTKYENELIDQEYSNENIIKKVEKINKKKKEIEKAQNNKVDKNEIKNEDTEIIIDGISCSQKNGSTIIGFSNNKNLMYISHDYGKNWIKKELPKNNKWSKIYLLEVRKNKFKIILFGTEKNIFLSTNNGDFWNHISTLKGHDLIHSEDYNYIYISTNNGILINNNEGLISSDTIGCINECKGIDNYINNYDGIYKFKIINDPNVKNKNINSIACTPDGNIIIVAINNEKIKVGKIKKEQEPRYINKKEEDRDKARWKYQYKESDKNLDNYEDEYGNLIWNFYEILETNNDITSIGVAEGIKKHSPDSFVICITNPLDVMVMAFQKYSGLPTNKVVGMAGILDSSRFKLFLSLELGIPVKEIDAMVMGGHGDTMVPLPRFTKVSGKPLLDLVKEGKISSEKLESINQRTRDGGAEIVKYLEKGSAFYAPAASGIEMASAYINDEKKLLPCAAYMNGEYGVNEIYAGVPVIIGKNGIEKIEEVKLDDKEKLEFNHSIEAVKKLWEAASAIDPDLKR